MEEKKPECQAISVSSQCSVYTMTICVHQGIDKIEQETKLCATVFHRNNDKLNLPSCYDLRY